jgi:assimilatory nitrate reductase catalytic subunit
LYEDGRFPTPSGRARFAAVTPAPLAEVRESRYPFSLNTGRLRDQWHGMSRTGWIGRLFGQVPEPVVQVHPQDMARHGWQEGDLVHLTSKRGSIVVPVQSSAELGLSQAFMGMHWGSEFLSGRQHNGQPLAGVNALTTSAYCPSSKQPELKHAAVKILKAELPWKLLALSWLPDEQAADALLRLRRLMPLFEFATCVPFGQARSGVLFRAASAEPVADSLVAEVADILHLSDSDVLHYTDRKRGQRRSMRMQRSGEVSHLEGFLLAGDIGAEAWIKSLLQESLPAQAYGRQLLSPGSKAPAGVVPLCKTVCSCVGVREDAIQAHLKAIAPGELAPEAAVASLKTNLGCGTQCGSCVPELQRLARLAEPSFTL